MTDKKLKRKDQIIEVLKNATSPISGSKLARLFEVSRQVIVQDIALLKAEEFPIHSTNRGYVLEQDKNEEFRIRKIFKVNHTDAEMETELNSIVDLGATVVDVFVNHKVYGTLRAELNLSSRRDVKKFLDTIDQGISSPLKNLTKNYHYHTIEADHDEILLEVESTLDDLGFLIKTEIKQNN